MGVVSSTRKLCSLALSKELNDYSLRSQGLWFENSSPMFSKYSEVRILNFHAWVTIIS